MECGDSSSLEGCSKCTYKLDNNEFTNLLDSVAIVSIFSELIKQSNLSPISKISLSKTTITCRGNIYPIYEPNDISDSTKHNRAICFGILNESN